MLINCPECQKQISDKAAACPHCGNPMTPVASPVNSESTKAASGIHFKQTPPRQTQSAQPTIQINTPPPPPVQTIEKTSKTWKAQQVYSALLACFGVLLAVGGSAAKESSTAGWGFFLMFAGIIWYAVVRVSIWWHHG